MDAVAASLGVVLRKWLDRNGVKPDLNAYFAEPPHVPAGRAYAGRFFERLDGGGDRSEACDRFTAADLVAVQMLSVNVPPETSIAILHGGLGRSLNQLLRLIPPDIHLGDPRASEHVREDSPAQKAWALLERENGTGYVTAGKLMARKRPHLIPV